MRGANPFEELDHFVMLIALGLLGAVVIVFFSCGGLGIYFLRGGRPAQPVAAAPPIRPPAVPQPPAQAQAQPRAPFGFADRGGRQRWSDETADEKQWVAQLGPTDVVYLSDLPELELQMGPWPFGKAGSLGDPMQRPIQVQGQRSLKGLSTHPRDMASTTVRYQLPGNAVAFRAAVALNDTAENFAGNGVQFEVLGDGAPLALSRVIERKGDFDVCYLDVSRAQILELKTYTLRSHFGCHTVWLEPRILQRKQQ
jgi:hypothetical protein